MAVSAARIGVEVEREAAPDQLSADVAAVRQVAGRDQPVVGSLAGQPGGNDPALANSDQRPLGFLPPWLVQFRRVDAGEPDFGPLDDDGVAVDDMAAAGEHERRRNRRQRRRVVVARPAGAARPPRDKNAEYQAQESEHRPPGRSPVRGRGPVARRLHDIR